MNFWTKNEDFEQCALDGVFLSYRQSFTSAVAGILSATNLDKTALLSKFCDDITTTAKAAKAKNFSKRDMKNFDDAVWKLTASLILMKPNVDERQLFTLTRAPVILFQADAMRTIGNFTSVKNLKIKKI